MFAAPAPAPGPAPMDVPPLPSMPSSVDDVMPIIKDGGMWGILRRMRKERMEGEKKSGSALPLVFFLLFFILMMVVFVYGFVAIAKICSNPNMRIILMIANFIIGGTIGMIAIPLSMAGVQVCA